MKAEKMKVKATQSCLILCEPMDCSLPGSFVYGIIQARILEWVAFSFSRGSSQHTYQTSSPACRLILYHLSHQGNPRTGVGSLSLLQRNLPNPGIEPGSPALQVESLPAELSETVLMKKQKQTKMF